MKCVSWRWLSVVVLSCLLSGCSFTHDVDIHNETDLDLHVTALSPQNETRSTGVVPRHSVATLKDAVGSVSGEQPSTFEFRSNDRVVAVIRISFNDLKIREWRLSVRPQDLGSPR